MGLDSEEMRAAHCCGAGWQLEGHAVAHPEQQQQHVEWAQCAGGPGAHNLFVPRWGHTMCWCLEPGEGPVAAGWQRLPGCAEDHPPYAGSSPRVSGQVIWG